MVDSRTQIKYVLCTVIVPSPLQHGLPLPLHCRVLLLVPQRLELPHVLHVALVEIPLLRGQGAVAVGLELGQLGRVAGDLKVQVHGDGSHCRMTGYVRMAKKSLAVLMAIFSCQGRHTGEYFTEAKDHVCHPFPLFPKYLVQPT